uniref:Ig-like domain-containing protein n=1 Tax=Periophthalmus magnuspinnatus TaxID=409849 RepID=A0A3B3ZYP7_9GOBI
MHKWFKITFLLDNMSCICLVYLCFTYKVVVSALGKKVMLPCSSNTTITDNMGVYWTKTDEHQCRYAQQCPYVLLHKDGHLDSIKQDSRFKNRVELADPNLKNNSLSLIISNVSASDSGEYQCRLIDGLNMFDVEPITTIQLNITEPVLMLTFVLYSILIFVFGID